MTTQLRDAAQQALEALEYHTAQTRPISQTNDAITALRAALEAEPTTEPSSAAPSGKAGSGMVQQIWHRRSAEGTCYYPNNAEPQEPVAWLIDCPPESAEIYNSDERSFVVESEEQANDAADEGWNVTPLYAAPQADRDALRYQFCRRFACMTDDEQGKYRDSMEAVIPDEETPLTPEMWDAAIDAAMAAEGEK